MAPPRDSVLRVSRDPRFELKLGAEIERCERGAQPCDPIELFVRGGDAGVQRLEVDHVILGTGFQIDLDRASLLAAAAPVIQRWRDRGRMTVEARLGEFLDFPYLGSGFEFSPRESEPQLEVSGAATGHWRSKLSSLYCFSFAAALSLGNISGDIPAVSEGAERLARAICRSFFTESSAAYWHALQVFDDPELLGDELEAEHWLPPLG